MENPSMAPSLWTPISMAAHIVGLKGSISVTIAKRLFVGMARSESLALTAIRLELYILPNQ